MDDGTVKLRVLIPTTAGPAEVLLLTEEDPVIGRSVACIGGTTATADIAAGYNAFVARPTGVIEGLFGHSCYRLDVSAPIDAGTSWQLGVLAAHALHASDRLAQENEPADRVLWATGSVRTVDLTVGGVSHIPEKIAASLPRLRQERQAGRQVLVAIPAQNAADFTAEHAAALASGGIEVITLDRVQALWEKLAIKPPEASRRIETALRRRHALAALAVDDQPSVAVLPLGAINGDSELDGFCDGLTNDIITGLSRVAAIRVIARNTMLTYQRRAVDVRTVGRELGVQYVIEGSARWSETKIRVSAQLTQATTGHHIWTQQFDRVRSEMLDVQDDIVKSIVASVQTQLILNEGRKSAAGSGPTENASQLLARAWQRFLRLTEESLVECGALADRALELDSKSGMAHRLLAVTLYHQTYMGFIPWSQKVIDRLYRHATAAIESEDADEYCYWAMCCAHLLRKEHASAIASLRRGLKINPNCSILHGSMGTVLAWDGQYEPSIECNELVLRINPQDPSNVYRHFGLALACYLARRYDEALVQAMDVVETRPSWWLGHLILCATLAQLGRHDEAGSALDRVKRMRSRLNASTLGMLPFARPSDREHLLDGLRKAGLSA